MIQIAWDRVEDWEDGVVASREWDEDRQETVALAYTDLSEGPLAGQEFLKSVFLHGTGPFENDRVVSHLICFKPESILGEDYRDTG